MKTGLILLIIGHLNFITGALVHGIVLRFVVSLRDAVSLQYAVSNTASAIAALLVPGGAGGGCRMDITWMQGGHCSIPLSRL